MDIRGALRFKKKYSVILFREERGYQSIPQGRLTSSIFCTRRTSKLQEFSIQLPNRAFRLINIIQSSLTSSSFNIVYEQVQELINLQIEASLSQNILALFTKHSFSKLCLLDCLLFSLKLKLLVIAFLLFQAHDCQFNSVGVMNDFSNVPILCVIKCVKG